MTVAEDIPASGQQAPSVPVTPIAPDSGGAVLGPADGLTTPGADVAPAASAPASDFPATPEQAPTSLLSEATKPDAEQAPADPQAEAKPAEPPPLPTFEAFTLPEGVTLQEEPLGKFTGLLGEYENKLVTTPAEAHATMQELGQKMVDLYINEMRDANERAARFQADNWTRTREQWVSEFKNDPEIGKTRESTTLQRAGAVIERYAAEVGADQATAFRNVAALTGFGDHPEVLRFMNWAAGYVAEQSRVIAAPPRPVAVQSKAQRLYRSSIGAA